MRKGAHLSQSQDWGQFAPRVYAHILELYNEKGIKPETQEAFDRWVTVDVVGSVASFYIRRAREKENPVYLLKAAHLLSQMHKKMLEIQVDNFV